MGLSIALLLFVELVSHTVAGRAMHRNPSGTFPRDTDDNAQAQSILQEISSPTFVPYARPRQKIEEFIAVGDSYTAGTGSNGIAEIIAADAVRGKRAYPMQMSTDQDNWVGSRRPRATPRSNVSLSLSLLRGQAQRQICSDTVALFQR